MFYVLIKGYWSLYAQDIGIHFGMVGKYLGISRYEFRFGVQKNVRWWISTRA